MKIQFKNVIKSFNGVKVLDEVNLTISNFGMYFLKGENGSGKTTFLNLISSFLKPDSGTILLNDEEASLDLNKKYVASYDVDLNLLDSISIRDNLNIVNKNYDELIKEFNLEYLLDKNINEISKGEKARIGILKVLLMDKPVILLDEPFAYMDSETANDFYNLIKRYAKSHIVIFTNHFNEVTLEDVNVIEIFDKKVSLTIKNIYSVEDKKACIKKCTLGTRTFSFMGRNRLKFIFTSLFLMLSVALFIPSLNFVFASKEAIFNQIVENENIIYATLDSSNREILEKYDDKNLYSKEIEDIHFDLKENISDQMVPRVYVVKGDSIEINNKNYQLNDEEPILASPSASNFLMNVKSFDFKNLFNSNGEKIEVRNFQIIKDFKQSIIFIDDDLLEKYSLNSSFLVDSQALRIEDILDTSIVNKCLLTTNAKIYNEVVSYQSIDSSLNENEVNLIVPVSEKTNIKLVEKIDSLIGKEYSPKTSEHHDSFDLYSYVDSIKIKGCLYLKDDKFPFTGAPFGLSISEKLYEEINKLNTNLNPLFNKGSDYLITSNNLNSVLAYDYNQFYKFFNADDKTISIDKFNALEGKDSMQIIFIILSSSMLLISIYFSIMFAINVMKQNKLNNYVLYENGFNKKEVSKYNLLPLLIVNFVSFILGIFLSIPIEVVLNLSLNAYSKNTITIDYFPISAYQIIVSLTVILIITSVITFIVLSKNNIKEVAKLKVEK